MASVMTKRNATATRRRPVRPRDPFEYPRTVEGLGRRLLDDEIFDDDAGGGAAAAVAAGRRLAPRDGMPTRWEGTRVSGAAGAAGGAAGGLPPAYFSSDAPAVQQLAMESYPGQLVTIEGEPVPSWARNKSAADYAKVSSTHLISTHLISTHCIPSHLIPSHRISTWRCLDLAGARRL